MSLENEKLYTFCYKCQNCDKKMEEIKELGGDINFVSKYSSIISATFPESNLPDIRKDPDLICVEQNHLVSLPQYNIDSVMVSNHRRSKPNRKLRGDVPPKKNTKKNLKRSKANASSNQQLFTWNIQTILGGKNRPTSGNGVKIGVIDTGIELNHPDLAANIKGGINIIKPGSSPNDDNGHGTHIAGTIAALNNSFGVVGIAPKASLYAIKVLDSSGSGSLLNLIKGIEWGIANGMHILNISISGGQVVNQALNKVIRAATKRGIIIVAAAGNSGSAAGNNDTVQIPARIKPVIAVAALKKDNTRDSYSATGNAVDIAAPGTKILSTYINNNYATLSGTSMATGHVSGIVAIYKTLFPSYTVEQIRSYLFKRARALGAKGNRFTGAGLAQI